LSVTGPGRDASFASTDLHLLCEQTIWSQGGPLAAVQQTPPGIRLQLPHAGYTQKSACGDGMDHLLLGRLSGFENFDSLAQTQHSDPVGHLKNIVQVV
jgi:hypothetical protein